MVIFHSYVSLPEGIYPQTKKSGELPQRLWTCTGAQLVEIIPKLPLCHIRHPGYWGQPAAQDIPRCWIDCFKGKPTGNKWKSGLSSKMSIIVLHSWRCASNLSNGLQWLWFPCFRSEAGTPTVPGLPQGKHVHNTFYRFLQQSLILSSGNLT